MKETAADSCRAFRAAAAYTMVMVLIALVAGCSGATTTTSAPAGTTTTTAAAMVPVAGTGVLIQDKHTDVVTEGTITQARGGTWVVSVTSSDPRVSGTEVLDKNTDGREDGSGETWGTSTLSNDNGTWEGNYTGSFIHADGNSWECFLLGTFKGTGAYAGLTYTAQVHWTVQSANRLGYVVSGWIEPTK